VQPVGEGLVSRRAIWRDRDVRSNEVEHLRGPIARGRCGEIDHARREGRTVANHTRCAVHGDGHETADALVGGEDRECALAASVHGAL